MEKLYKKLMAIEIAVLIICVVLMFIPVVEVNCGMISNEKINSWHAIFGLNKEIGSTQGKFTTFSFLCLLPYLLLILIFVLNLIFDNKNNLFVDFGKLLLFITSAILFIFYIRLLNYNSFFVNYSEVKKYLTPQAGHILSAIVCFLGAAAAILEIIRDIKYKRD